MLRRFLGLTSRSVQEIQCVDSGDTTDDLLNGLPGGAHGGYVHLQSHATSDAVGGQDSSFPFVDSEESSISPSDSDEMSRSRSSRSRSSRSKSRSDAS